MPANEDLLLQAARYASNARELQKNALFNETLDAVVSRADQESESIDLTGADAGQAAISALINLQVAKRFRMEMLGGIDRALRAEEALKERDKKNSE